MKHALAAVAGLVVGTALFRRGYFEGVRDGYKEGYAAAHRRALGHTPTRAQAVMSVREQLRQNQNRIG